MVRPIFNVKVGGNESYRNRKVLKHPQNFKTFIRRSVLMRDYHHHHILDENLRIYEIEY